MKIDINIQDKTWVKRNYDRMVEVSQDTLNRVGLQMGVHVGTLAPIAYKLDLELKDLSLMRSYTRPGDVPIEMVFGGAHAGTDSELYRKHIAIHETLHILYNRSGAYNTMFHRHLDPRDDVTGGHGPRFLALEARVNKELLGVDIEYGFESKHTLQGGKFPFYTFGLIKDGKRVFDTVEWSRIALDRIDEAGGDTKSVRTFWNEPLSENDKWLLDGFKSSTKEIHPAPLTMQAGV